jgi:uncharacterized protein
VDIITADTNLYVSAFSFGGKPLQLIELARVGRIRLAISDPIRDEVRRVLGEKFGWTKAELVELDGWLPTFTMRVSSTQRVDVVEADPDDDRIIECAIATGSTIIVSGDRHLLNLQEYQGISILRVAEYLRRIPT